jgi:hypothetical protein
LFQFCPLEQNYKKLDPILSITPQTTDYYPKIFISNWQVFEAIYKKLLQHYSCTLKHREGYKVIEDIKGKSVKIVDATIMSVCLSFFWEYLQ